MNGEPVTISDCGRALQEIEEQIAHLKRQKIAVDRKIEALRTQGFLISKLVKLL